MSKMRSYLFVAGACIVMAAQLLRAGPVAGAITGTVQDPRGAVVPGAQVKIINQDTTVVATHPKDRRQW